MPNAVSLLTIATVLGNGTASRRSEVPREREEEEASTSFDDDPPSFDRLDGLAEDDPERLLLEVFVADLDEDMFMGILVGLYCACCHFAMRKRSDGHTVT